MNRKKINRIMFSWVFPEITIIAKLYGLTWYENIINNYSGAGSATLEFVKNILAKFNPSYHIQDALILEGYLISLLTGLEQHLDDSTFEYFDKKIKLAFSSIVLDARKGYIRLFDNEKVPTQDVLYILSERIELMISKAIQNFKKSLSNQDVNIYSIGRNIIVEYDYVDKCTIIETIVQCSKVHGFQFLPHII